MSTKSLVNTPAWKALERHHTEVAGLQLRELFAADPQRGEKFTAEAAGLFLDYSKNRITEETMRCWWSWPRSAGLRGRIDAMFRGEKINMTENRAVLHVALRAPREANRSSSTARMWCPDVHAVLDKMAAFADRVRRRQWKGHTGKRIRNVVNIGIGGSDLGPVMAYEALQVLQRPRADRCGSSPTSTAPISPKPCAVWIRRRRCSSSRRRPSRRWRR